jgi:hypothetical protein
MTRTTGLVLCATALFAFGAGGARAQTCPVDAVTGNAVARMLSPTNGSSIPEDGQAGSPTQLPAVDPVSGLAGAVTFQWCNAGADYFLTVESVPGAHDVYNAFAGGRGAGVESITLGPTCNTPTPTDPTTQCIPSRGEKIFVTLFTLKNNQILAPSPFHYTFTAPSTAATLAAAVLPSSRSVQVGTVASAFATIINTGSTTALGCSIAPSPPIAGATFSYQATDPSTNRPTGTPNTPVDIPPSASQFRTFLITFTASTPFAPLDVHLNFQCSNAPAAPVLTGLNTLLLSASSNPVPDIVALAATLNNDGIVNIPGASGAGAFAVATVNVGTAGQITVSADTGGAKLPVTVLLCQTNPVSGQCTSAMGASVTTTIGAGETPTFGVFVFGSGAIGFDPAASRIAVRFRDAQGVMRGSTSVAVRTQ